MTPTPQEHAPLPSADESGEKVVISGMSGLYPESHNVKEFSKILYDKINPITDQNGRWSFSHPEASNFLGKIPDIDKFDSKFFKVHQHQSDKMDPSARKVLEQSYQAMYDAGISPSDIKGKKIGVFVAASQMDTESSGFLYTAKSKSGFAITGCSKTMIANRISYWLDVKGPSLTYDDACCGSYLVLQNAYMSILRGECEAAIVGAINCILSPQNIVHTNRCTKIAFDGKTKSFDENADGCCKSDTIGVMFLQKAKHAKRVYAEVVYAKTEFVSRLEKETGQMFGFIRDPSVTAEFIHQFYNEAGVSPAAVEYVEAVGSGTPEADKAELLAIERVFCEGRKNTLLVGSVMSNAGFSDSAMGMTALTKTLLGYHTGKIASNLHCENPRKDIAALQNGSMKIVRDHETFNQTYVAINGMSVAGSNSHILLKGYSKPKDMSRYTSSIPYLVTLSGRQQSSLEKIFADLKSRSIDPEELALLHSIHSSYISGHLGRGYIILDTDMNQNTRSLKEFSQHIDAVPRPLCFVYSGMGSQWAGMGTQLLRIPVFAAAIEKCRKVLQPKGLDLIHIITAPEETIFDNVLHSFVGIAAIQIGLTDVLRQIGIVPDKLIGHSVGELGCAYADGCLTAEETILFAYSRGVVSNENITSRGAMAAVGKGFKAIKDICPKEIDIACHNGPDSCTISGPEKELRDFVASLKASGTFAKEVPCSNIAYHSRYIAEAGPHLLQRLKSILTKPTLRSKKWLSTSVPQHKWNEPSSKYCSAEYMTNNLLNSVLFEETCKNVPNNAILIEIAPHGLLQAILKRSLSEDCKNIPLTRRNHEDGAVFLLEAIGKLYIEGVNPKLQAIYPKVEFPVSNGTPHLSHFGDWVHTDSWQVMNPCTRGEVVHAASCNYKITTHDDEYNYLTGNVVQGKTLYPFAAALVAVWETVAMLNSVPKEEMAVRFQDVHLISQPILHEQKLMNLEVELHKVDGRFQVSDGGSIVASGFIFQNDSETFPAKKEVLFDSGVESNEIYQHFGVQGFCYKNDFQSINKLKLDEVQCQAEIVWTENWATFIDALLQLNYLNSHKTDVWQPSQIRQLVIDAKRHSSHVKSQGLDRKVVNAEVENILDHTLSGGILMQNIKFRKMATEKLSDVEFKLYASSELGSDHNNKELIQKEIASESLETSDPNVHRITLKIEDICNLESLRWDNIMDQKVGLKVKVHFAGINMNDVKRATGIIPIVDEGHCGMDYSGVADSGVRVMGVVRKGAVSTEVTAHDALTWPVPAHWSLEEAATVPLAYTQAYYCLCIKNNVRKDSTILIHGGAGALGQAAIAIALANDCEVFTTVADDFKKQCLIKLFPKLKEDHIGSSRDGSFSDMVLSATNGKGCNLILSCVQGELKNACLKCTAFSGTTVDISQLQHTDDFEYGMFNLTRQRSYMCVDLTTIFEPKYSYELTKIHSLIQDGIARGIVRPLSHIVYSAHEAAKAFRLLAASRHCGRVLIRLEPLQSTIDKRMFCNLDNSSLIIWDGDSFGLQLAKKLIKLGSKKLLIHLLNPSTKFQLTKSLWEKQGVEVILSGEKLNHQNDIVRLVNEAKDLGPIDGVFVAATDRKRCFDNVLPAIIHYLDVATRELCPSLRYFTVMSLNKDIDQTLQLLRSANKMPLTFISFPDINKMNRELSTTIEKSVWDSIAADVIETTEGSGYPLINVRPKLVENAPLSQEITKIIGEANIQAYDQNLTLREINLAKHKVMEISANLENKFHISLFYDDILAMNKEKMQQLELPDKLPEPQGLGKFLQYVDEEELVATTDLVQMDTLVTNTNITATELELGDTFLCIVPGVEGHHARFQSICRRLKLPALVLQPGLDHPNEDTDDMAYRFSKILLNKMGLSKNFILLGYEYGVSVALSLAAILEEQGLTGTVFCIGNGPKALKMELEDKIKEFPSEEALKMGIARHLVGVMSKTDIKETTLENYKSWEQFVYDMRLKYGCGSHTTQFVRSLIETVFARISLIRAPKSAARALKSQIVQMRTLCDFDDDVSALQNYSSKPIVVYDLDVPLVSSTEDLRCASLINRHLPQEVLNSFKNFNLCKQYCVTLNDMEE